MDEAKRKQALNPTTEAAPIGSAQPKDSIMNTLNKIFSAAATAAVLLSANAAFAATPA